MAEGNAINVGSVEVDVVPTAKGIDAKITAATEPAAKKAGKASGETFGSNFSDTAKQRITAALKTLPKASVRADASEAEKTIAEVRKELQSLKGKIGFELSDEEALAKVEELKAKLDAVAKDAPSATVKADISEASAKLDEIKAKADSIAEAAKITVEADTTKADAELDQTGKKSDELGAKSPTVKVSADTTKADAQIGTFATKVNTEIGAALKAIPKLKIDADSSAADFKLAALRAELEGLSGKTIGVDIDEGAALSEIALIKKQLDALAKKSPSVRISVDAAEASAKLAAIDAEADAVGKKRESIFIGADGSSAIAGIGAVGGALGALKTASIGAGLITLAPLVAGAVALAGPLAAAAIGFAGMAAVAVPAVTDIKNALDAQKKAAGQVKTATTALKTANDQVASSEQSLADAQRSANQQAIQSAEAVANAKQGLADAEKQQTRDAQSNAEAVANAEKTAAQQRITAVQAVQNAEQTANQNNASALQQVHTAEESLQQAQIASKNAQQALTQARKDAADQLKQLQFQTSDAALAQRGDELAVTQAKQSLDATNANKKATQLQRQQAQLNYDQAVQALKEQQYQTKQLAATKADADKKGVKGADQVVAAQQSLVQANQSLTDNQKSLADAQKNVVTVQLDGVKKVAQAQAALVQTEQQGAQSVADAQRKSAQSQVDDAESVAKAQQGINDAVRNQQFQAANSASSIQQASGAVQKALAGQKTAQQELDEANSASKGALDKLTPSEKAVAKGYDSIKTSYKNWTKALAPKVLPDLTGAMGDLSGVMDIAAPAIDGAAGAVGGLEKKAQDALKSSFWSKFSKFLGPESHKAINGFGTAIGNVVTGVAGMFQGSSSLGNIVLSGLDDVTGDFANWGKNYAKNGPGQTMLDNFKKLKPKIVSLLGNLAGLIGALFSGAIKISPSVIQFLSALAKYLTPVVAFILGDVATALNAVAAIGNKYPTAFKIVAGGLLGIAAALFILNAAADAGPVGIAIAAVALLVIGLVELVKHFDAVKNAIVKWGSIVAGPLLWFIAIPLLIIKYWGPISGFISRVAKDMVSPFKSVPGAMEKYGKLIFLGLYHGLKSLWDNTINNAFLAHMNGMIGKFFNGSGNWLVSEGKSIFTGLWHGIKFLWDNTIDNQFLAHINGKIGNFFKGAGGWLTSAGKSIMGGLWGGLKSGFKSIQGWFTGAINWIINNVINKFIGLLNKIPGVSLKTVKGIGQSSKAPKGTPTPTFNNNKLSKATGGVLPGWSPGKDIHTFYSPTAGSLHLSGGEAIMRPEFTAAVGGPSGVDALNSWARGKSGGKNPDDRHYLFGGVLKDIGKFGKYTASKIKNVDNAVDPLHLVNHVFDGAVNLAAKTARGVIGSMPFGDAGKAMAKGVIGAVQNAVLHDGHADTKKAVGDGSGGGGDFISYASQFLGQPYVWGGDHPGGFDCSGLTSYVMDHFGLKSPRTASAQEAWSKPISQSAALPGDLVFYGGQVGKGGAHHVAFYDGDNKILEAQQTGVPLLIDAYRKGGLFGRAPGASKFLGGGFLSGLFGGGDGKIASGSKGQEQTYAKSLFGRHGWAASQLAPLISLWNGESGWNPNVQNPGSTAYGIAQFLNSTWGKYGPKTANWKKQIEYGEDYIDDDYTTPANAFSKWSSREPHWYGSGLSGGIFTKPTMIGVGDGGPERVDVTPLRGGSSAGGSGPMRIRGTLDMGNGLTGYVDGLIDSALDSVAKQVTHGRVG